jgi:hypothetical protein
MRLEEDTNSQCTCFGAAIKPVRDCNYEKSKELFMYRAYNGCVVARRVVSSRVSDGDGLGHKAVWPRLRFGLSAHICMLSLHVGFARSLLPCLRA